MTGVQTCALPICSRKRRETSNRGHIHSCFLQERQRSLENSEVVVVQAEDQTGLDGYGGVMELLDAVQVALGLVEGFAHFPEAGGGDGLQPDEERFATAGRGELDEIIVIHNVEGGLAGPPFAQRNQAAKEVAGIVQVSDDIVVPEDQRFQIGRASCRERV